MDLGTGTPQSPLSSASVILLRDAPGGLEVFLLERNGLSDVLGGAYVFPVGKTDGDDLGLVSRLTQPPVLLHAALGEPGLAHTHAAALYVAAIRELFEEAGVLFARVRDGARAARELHRAGRTFGEVVEALAVPLETGSMVPWSRWVTPAASVRARKHFDARFFVAGVPAGQEPVHDEHEATHSVWLPPASALRRYWDGQIQLAPPQIMTLAHLARFRDVAGVLAEARGRHPPRIQPEVMQEDGANMVCYPGDPRHSQGARAMPGPTRLCWRNGRYEPQDGLEELFA
jgi:8-oxo-dGTP pyrophosphatase MutT (NUDIX family)